MHQAASVAPVILWPVALDSFGAPVGSDIGKALGCAGQQLAEQHAGAIYRILFSSDDVRLTNAGPVIGSIEDRFQVVAVGEMSVHWRWPWKPAHGVVAQRFLAETKLGQSGLPTIVPRISGSF